MNNRIEIKVNKCICFKTPLEGPPVKVEKGDTFTYFLRYDGGLPMKVELYDVNTGRHIFSMSKRIFGEYFIDIIEFREKQIEKILD
jgi:hypothetical protein